jgi:hypothetical protein
MPTDSHKSFYGKARVIIDRDANTETLVSYETEIVRRDMATGKLIKLWDGWTATTGRHISAFCGLNKAGYNALEMGV